MYYIVWCQFPGITMGPCHTSPGQQPTHRIQNKEAESRDRTGYPSLAHGRAMTADCWALSFSDWWYLVTRRWIMSNLVSFTRTIDSKISALLWQHWRFRIKLLCVTQNIEHIYRAPASDYILLEFCSFPTEHMIIITVLLHCYLEFIIASWNNNLPPTKALN